MSDDPTTDDECDICGEDDRLRQIQTLSNPLMVCRECAENQPLELLNTIRELRAEVAQLIAELESAHYVFETTATMRDRDEAFHRHKIAGLTAVCPSAPHAEPAIPPARPVAARACPGRARVPPAIHGDPGAEAKRLAVASACHVHHAFPA